MSDLYESRRLLDEYLLFHYGSEHEVLPAPVAWPQAMIDALGFAERTPSHFSPAMVERSLDLGCAVGRSAFAMAEHSEHVIGIDFSRAFIGAAEQLRTSGSIAYERHDEGHLRTALVAKLAAHVAPHRISFLVGDAMHLPPGLADFDRVHAANLLCRLTDPLKLINRLPSLVREGGELILATPCTWLEEYTPRESWPAGSTFDWLVHHLSPHFALIKSQDEPFLIRETSRKFQWTRSLLTHWQRTSA